ncbi:GTP-binding protein [Streptomyces chromofuscus]|uniref:ATP/GTP-binding protein n=1 Tax=Streptomyces chromofuscus TaxID=42881 RepID=A0A7M2T340_STRCW|nr:ATP/GTP-binding protein [Streptomyces chromofuscus]QOV43056.1 ATP/GTP-binding protein [Streptomyces chromofuscus]GGS93422.1 ATP-binding protein [Streptomyces chromofuscus]
MPYAPSSDAARAGRAGAPPEELKIIVAGGFGVGKTTMIATVSEIEPLTTEERLTIASSGIDNLEGLAHKATTTVAMDFGRITFDDPFSLILFLFGTPGQERFWFLWDDLGHGALGVVVLVDTRRLEDSFAAVGWCEQRHLPFVVAVNEFDNAFRYTPDEVRQALGLAPCIPVVTCDVRQSASAMNVLITLVGHSLELSRTPNPGALT